MKNKKLFAILTLVCFMMTLMPVAAFAAPEDLSATASVFATADANADLSKNEETLAQISLKNAKGNAYSGSVTSVVYVWAEKSAGQPTDAFVAETIVSGDDDYAAETAVAVASVGKGVYKITTPKTTAANAAAVSELYISFLRAGEYTLRASFDNPLEAADYKDVVLFAGASSDFTKVTVSAAAAETEDWAVAVEADRYVTGTDYGNDTIVTDGEETADKDKKIADQDMVIANVPAVGVKTTEVTLTVLRPTYDTEGNVDELAQIPVTGYPVALDTDSSNIELSKTNATTNHNGQVSFKVSGEAEGDYRVFVTVGDIEVVVNVRVGASIANDIEVIKAPEAPIAKDEKTANYGDYIQFQITDVNGNVVTGDCAKAVNAPAKGEEAYVTLLEQPAGAKIADKDIFIKQVEDEKYYTVALTNGKTFTTEGTYTAKVILDNGRYATVTWEVKKFGTPVELVLTYKQEAVELNGKAVIDELVYVDANGVKKAAKDVDLAASGYAIAMFYPNVEGTIAKGTVTVKNDEKYVGSTINVTAVSERYNLVANATIKVTADAAELAFATKTAEVNVNNKIDVQIVDADGNKVAPTNAEKAEIYYVVLDKPEGAKVSVATASDKDLKAKGQFTMALTSNKIGNVTVQAVLKYTATKSNTNTSVTKYYTGTQIFAVGNGSVGDVVVMSVGSNEIVINDKKATIDAAPIVKNDRTFVPFRALAEAFGAEVAYDEATQAVTAELNGVKVVMTIGSATYTVNGAEKTMDVAPFINGSRTMVPVRFVAEAFGIKVIPTYDENGATADILFNL